MMAFGGMKMRYQEGFSLIKLMFVLLILGIGTWVSFAVLPVYSTYWKVEDAFESMSRNLANRTAEGVLRKLPEVFHVKYISQKDLPQEFYDNLKIKADGNRIEISSAYHVTIWLLGPLEGVNPDEGYTAGDLKGMDKLRDKARLDFDFEPYAETP